MIVLDCHKEQVFVFFGGRGHISPVAFQKLNHFDVSVESCEVKSCDSVLVGHIDPGFELVLK